IRRREDHAAEAEVLRLARERAEERDRLIVRVAVVRGAVEMIPDREPGEPVRVREGPEAAQFLDRNVLLADVKAERNAHRGLPFVAASLPSDGSVPALYTPGAAPRYGTAPG